MSLSHGLNIMNLNEFLITLPINVLEHIYQEPSAVLTIYRELNALSQTYIMRLLFVNQPISHPVFNSWVKSESLKLHQDAVQLLTSLNILISPINISFPSWTLNHVFKSSLRDFILKGAFILLPKCDLPPDKHAKTVEALEKYANERWECVLHYMVGSHVKKDNVSKDTRDLLLCSGLMKAASNDSLEVSISKEGFQFLLLDTNSQIWYFLLYHFEMLKDRPDELVESLKFLLQLNFSVVGQDYPSNNLSITINKLLQNLRELGIVYQRKRSDGRFYPTSLAVSLICASQNSKASKYTSSSTFNNHDKRLGHIIVETNFRVYAYSDSDLQIEVLSLFCDMQYRFPKFCIGIITRDSIRQALKFGITANQIINYLKVHAHPITLKNANPVPMTVSDQIMLWEMEKCRLKFTEGVLYNQFSTRSDFDIIQACAQNINVVEWSSRNKRVLIVSKDGHDEVKKFWKSHKSSP